MAMGMILLFSSSFLSPANTSLNSGAGLGASADGRRSGAPIASDFSAAPLPQDLPVVTPLVHKRKYSVRSWEYEAINSMLFHSPPLSPIIPSSPLLSPSLPLPAPLPSPPSLSPSSHFYFSQRFPMGLGLTSTSTKTLLLTISFKSLRNSNIQNFPPLC